MLNTPHDFNDDFPAQSEKIQALKASNAHFAQLADRYVGLNRTLFQMETNVEPADDFTMEELKKERLKLMDEISSYLR